MFRAYMPSERYTSTRRHHRLKLKKNGRKKKFNRENQQPFECVGEREKVWRYVSHSSTFHALRLAISDAHTDTLTHYCHRFFGIWASLVSNCTNMSTIHIKNKRKIRISRHSKNMYFPKCDNGTMCTRAYYETSGSCLSNGYDDVDKRTLTLKCANGTYSHTHRHRHRDKKLTAKVSKSNSNGKKI